MGTAVLISIHDHIALGIRTLAGSLRGHGHRAQVIFLKPFRYDVNEVLRIDVNQIPLTPAEEDQLVNVVAKTAPDWVGISTVSTTIPTAIRVTEALRNAELGPIIWGGIGPTVDPEFCIRFADALVVGEGDKSVLEIAARLHQRGPAGGEARERLKGIGNLWVWGRGGEVAKGTQSPLVADLDSLPPLFAGSEDALLLDHTIQPAPSLGHLGEYYAMTQRGCPYACSYCCHSVLKPRHRGEVYVRRQSVDRVIEELRPVPQKGFKFVAFWDEVFTVKPQWVREFARRYPKEVGLPFFIFVAPGFCNPELLQILKEAGLRRVTIGVQSGCDRTNRELFNRRIGKEQMLKDVRTLHRLGVDLQVDLISSNPLESEEDCRETLELLLNFPRPFRLNVAGLAFFPNYPVTRRFEEFLKNRGLPPNADLPQMIYFGKIPPVVAEAFDHTRNTFYHALYLLTQFHHVDPESIRRLAGDVELRKNGRLSQELVYILTAVHHEIDEMNIYAR